MKRRGFIRALTALVIGGPTIIVAAGTRMAQPSFRAAQDALRAHFDWREQHATIYITWEELKQDGITILDSGFVNNESKRRFVKLVEHKITNT